MSWIRPHLHDVIALPAIRLAIVAITSWRDLKVRRRCHSLYPSGAFDAISSAAR